MSENNKILLNKEKSVTSVNITEEVNINLDNTTKPLPLSDEQHTVSAFEQFEKERQQSTIYRFYGVVNPLLCNPLYNSNIHVSGSTNPNLDPIGITIPADSIFDKDGWLGYFDDNFTEDNPDLCQFKPFDPGYDRLEIIDPDGNPNYMLKITYPYATKDIQLVQGTNLSNGIPIIEKMDINIHDRSYTGFRTPINHGLTVDDEIKMYNFQDNSGYLGLTRKTVKVHKLGNQTNDETERIFVVDINPADINVNVGQSTIKRSVRGTISDYYVRVFSALTTDYVDYEIYPAAYGINYFYDKEAAFYFKKDIDVKDIRDNLGRPLSELFLTIIKNDEDADITSPSHQYWMNRQAAANPALDVNIVDRFWTPLVAGYKTEKDANVNYNIRGVGADPLFTPAIPQVYFTTDADPSAPFGSLLDESNNVFDGDIVEYNSSELTEIPLEEIYHRVNTVFREYASFCNVLPDLVGLIDSEQRLVEELLKDNKEGYIYLPHRRIEIRAFSTFIEEGDSINTIGIPDYATLKYSASTQSITTGPITTLPLTKVSKFYKWRDLLDIGYVDNDLVGVDYPFESGAHYINIVTRFYLQRQDPPCDFALLGLSFDIPTSGGYDTMPTFEYLSSLPTYFDYMFPNPPTLQAGADEAEMNDMLTESEILVRMLEYYGEYNLGPRNTPGGCVNLYIIETKTLDDDC